MDKYACQHQSRRIARKVQDFFERRYELHYNEMKRIEEFRPKGHDFWPWQPLTDPTGSRRYLCVEVTGIIDTESPVNYQQLYAQAVN